MELDHLLETALAAARDAAAVHVAHLGTVTAEDWTEKGAADFVTHVDQAAERSIVDRVRREFPQHAIVAEEAATADGATPTSDLDQLDWAWVVDPLDGTTNYLHGYPMYAVSIAVAHKGEPVAGVVLNSASGETWTAVRGGGAYRNGRRVQVSGIDRLSRALIGTGFPFKALHLLPAYMEQLQATLRSSSGVRRAGSAALDLCHLATGWFDGFWELTLAPWDVAAGTLMVREAGGVVTRMDGDSAVLGHGSILAGNPVIYNAMATLLREVDADGLNREL